MYIENYRVFRVEQTHQIVQTKFVLDNIARSIRQCLPLRRCYGDILKKSTYYQYSRRVLIDGAEMRHAFIGNRRTF